MPVDNDNIESHLDLLDAKAEELRKKSHEAAVARNHLGAILQRQRDEPDPNDATKTIRVDVDIMDERAGKKMVAARRQEIYDYWIAEADKLLA